MEDTVPYADEVSEGKYIVVCCLSDDGNVTYVRGTHDATAKQVDTNLFSNYAVFVSGDPAVVVDGGSGAGPYAEGTTVTIKADSKSGYTFAGWEVVSDGVTLTDSKAAETTFAMPAANVELRAAIRRPPPAAVAEQSPPAPWVCTHPSSIFTLPERSYTHGPC